jgi:hypothetical protein
MTRPFLRDLAALVLVVLGLGATISAGGLDPRAIVLAVATVFAWGTTATWGLGLLACLTGIAAHPFDLQPILPTPAVLAAIPLGAATGLVARHLARQRWIGPLRPDTLRALIALALGFLFVFQPSDTRLADTAGVPLLATLDVFDPLSGLTTRVARHVALPLPHPLAALAPVIAAATLVAAWVGFARIGTGKLRSALFISTASVAVLAAGAGLVAPFLSTPIIDVEMVREALNLRAGGDGAITALHIPEATFAPWSRAPLDGLRLVVALGLLILSLFQPLQFHMTRTPAGMNAIHLALAALVVGFALGGLMPETSAAAFAIAFPALLAGRAGSTRLDEGTPATSPPRAPQVAYLLALFVLLALVTLAPLRA